MTRFGINLRLTTPEEALEDSVVNDPEYKLKSQPLGRLVVGTIVVACVGLLVWDFYKFGAVLQETYGPLVPFYAIHGSSIVCTGLFFSLILLDSTYGSGVPELINMWPILLGSILRVLANFIAGDQLPEYHVNYLYQILIEIIANGIILFTFMTEDGCDNFMHVLKPWTFAIHDESETEI